MTEPVRLPALLSAMATETAAIAATLAEVERHILPALGPLLAAQPDLSARLQPLDLALQRLAALQRIAATAAAEAPDHPMPATTDRLAAQRLAGFLTDLRPEPPPVATAPVLFGPLP